MRTQGDLIRVFAQHVHDSAEGSRTGRLTSWRWICAFGLAFLLLPAQGCERSDTAPAEDVFAPRLLDDRAAVDAYLLAFPYRRYRVYEVPTIGRFYVDQNPSLAKQAIREGKVWEPHVIEEFEKYVAPGSTVIDVGAHLGSHTVTLARLVGPDGRVYAFEPQKKIFRELVYNLALNENGNAVPLRFALSSQPRIIEMDPVRRADGAVGIGAGGDRAEARTLDSFRFSDVSLIKIDVEGHETDVLLGAVETLAASRPVIITEIYRAPHYDVVSESEKQRIDETKRTLNRLGYRYRTILPGGSHEYIAFHETDERGDVPAAPETTPQP